MIDKSYAKGLIDSGLSYINNPSLTAKMNEAWDRTEFLNLTYIENCVDRFVEAEMDYATPGERGLGRMTTYYPRFGAYARKKLSRLSPDEINEIKQCMTDLILNAYAAQAIVGVKGISAVIDLELNEDPVFQQWIPMIYGNEEFTSKDHENILMMMTGYSATQLMNSFEKYGVKQKKELKLICFMYIVAGWKLRAVENTFMEFQEKGTL